MSKFTKKFMSAVSALAIVFSILAPAAGVNAVYENSLEAANKLASMGVIVDQSANPADYRLGDTVTRREIAKVAVKVAATQGVSENTECRGDFADLSADDWGCKYAETLLDNSMVAANTNFNPDADITQAEALKMMMNAAGVAKVEDEDDVWANDYVNGAVDAGIVEDFSDYDTAAQRGWIFKIAANALDIVSDDEMSGEEDDLLEELLGGLDDDEEEDTTEEGEEGEEGEDTVVSGDDVLTVSLSPETPEGASIPGGVSGLPVAAYDFTAGSEDVTVTSITVKRRGLSDKGTLGGLAAFSEDGRASKAKDDSQENDTEATLTLTNGFVVKAGETRTLTIVADVNSNGATSAVANDEFAIELMEVVASTTADSEGSLVGDTFRVGSVDAPSLLFDQDGTVSNPTLGEEGVDIFKFEVKGPNGEDAYLKAITFKADSSNAEDDLINFKLYNEGTEVAATAMMNDKYISFDLGDGLAIAENKTEKFTVTADVVAGAGDVISFYIDKNLDVSAEGTKYGYGASVDITTNLIDQVGTLGTITLQAGELTLVDIDASSDKIRENKDDVELGSIKVTNVAGQNLELQKFGIQFAVTTTSFVDDGIGGGTADNNTLDVGEVAVTNLDELFENVELYNEDTGASYDLTRLAGGAVLTDVYQDTDLNVILPQGTTNFVLRADTKDNIGDFDLTTLNLSLDASLNVTNTADANTANGQFIVVETDDDKLVTDLTPSSLSWKATKGSESSATVALVPLANLTKVRGAEDVVALQFEVEADESSDLNVDEVKVYVRTAAGNATNNEVSQVTLYQGSISEDNLLDRVSGSNLSAGVATFDGFDVEVAANDTETFIVTVSIVDGPAAVANTPIDMRLNSVSVEDEDSDDVQATGTPSAYSRTITVTNFGTLAIAEDANNDDNKDPKTVLAGTSEVVFSADVQATNESVDVEKVVFTVDTDLTKALTSASLYLDDTLVATNANSDITPTTITFDNMTDLIIPQESKELRLALNTANIGFEEVGLSIAGLNVTIVSLEDAEGVDSGKVVANQSIA